MNINEQLKNIINQLDNAIDYEDWDIVEEVQSELLFILRDLDSEFPDTENY